ncbi:MAG: hypothetical protein AB7E85_07265 [Pseudobdellovibrionaceae bacterium]
MTLSDEINFIKKNLKSLTTDDIVSILAPYRDQFEIRCPLLNSKSFFYRGRLLGEKLVKEFVDFSKLSYPKKNNISLGRANREGASTFYCCSSKEAVFYELDVKKGDEIILTNWQNTVPMLVSHIGYDPEVLKKLGSTRKCPDWAHSDHNVETFFAPTISNQVAKKIYNLQKQRDQNYQVRKFFNDEFTSLSKDNYHLTNAIAEFHLGNIHGKNHQFAGITYPSVRMSGNSDNLAILPSFFDKHFTLRRISHIRILNRAGKKIQIKEVDYATEIDSLGRPSWKGRTLKWEVKSQEFVTMRVESGRDKFGYYELGKDGQPLYWQAYNSRQEKIDPI